MQKITFTVDAALVQELGERLIGQPQIALAELVKNSYDADASTCQITFSEDKIEINDDGHGMAFQEFSDYWMRIGTTHKLEDRISKKLNRPLTGSKGIGRLAVQFLAKDLTLETTAKPDPSRMLYAIVDWGKIQKGDELQDVGVEYEFRSNERIFPYDSPTGTRITLSGLKEPWTRNRLIELGDALWRLRSPFRARRRAPRERGPEDFNIEVVAPHIEGAQDAFDTRLNLLFSNWRARITGRLENGRSKDATATITVEFKENFPDGAPRKRFSQRVALPIRREATDDDPFIDTATFEILVFKLEGRQGGQIQVGDLRDYLEKFGNVSIYDAGFRLPYYGMEQDWLDITKDQARRIAVSQLLPDSLKGPDRYMLDLPAPARIFGAVEINTRHERAVAESRGAAPDEWLQLQPGRDRLHDNAAYRQLRDLVRYSLDFYANRYRARALQQVEEERDREPSSAKQQRALKVLDENKSVIPARVYKEVRGEVADALNASRLEEEELDRRAALLAPLASAGMAALALNHELGREIRLLTRSVSALRRMAKKHKLSELSELATKLEASAERLSSLQDLFAPLLSDEDKEATDRLKVKPIVEHSVRSLEPLMPGVSFQLDSIPADLRLPIGSFAEWNALFQNVISNAWNAMLETDVPKINIEGGRSGKNKEWVRISDTGKGLDMPAAASWSDKLFEPFERRLEIREDLRSLAIGGQGLGLAIVRMIARRRGAEVHFVEPLDGYSTTFELSWRS